MQPEYRDGLLAFGCLFGLTGLSAATGGVENLFDPIGIVAGIALAVAVEAVFLRYSSWLLETWDHRGAPLVGFCTVLGVGVIAVWFSPCLVTVLFWGLIGYLGLLGCVLLGIKNPVSMLPGT